MRFTLSTILFTLLFFVANSERTSISLLQKRMISNTNANGLCDVKDFSVNPKVSDNCPGGSICVETGLIGNKKVGRCQMFTLKEHQGASAFDYVASSELKIETAISSNGAALDCNHNDASLSANAKWRCLELAVHLQDIDPNEYAQSCEVEYKGGIGSKLTGGNLTTSGHDLAGGAANTGLTKLGGDTYAYYYGASAISCYFSPTNNLYVGASYAQITFTKLDAYLALGEKKKKIVKLPLRHVPGDRAVAGSVSSTDGYVSDPIVSAAHSLISSVSGGGLMYGDTASKSNKGTMKLKYSYIVQDKRYKTMDQSGVEALPDRFGPFKIIKEGLEIHADYKNFYDASQNAFANTEIYATPLTHNLRKGANTECATQGNAAAGQTATTCTTGTSAKIYDDKAQFLLEGVYEATYGGLPHFKKGYIGCQLCENRLAVKGFENSGGNPALDAAFTVTPASLVSGCTGTACIHLQNIFAEVKQVGMGHEKNKALRLPNCDSSGNNCGVEAQGFDPQHANGHVLGEFLTPIVIGTNGVAGNGATSYADLDANFNFLGATRLVVTGSDGRIDNTASGTIDTGLAIHSDCASKGSGKVYTMSNDMQAAANQLFFEDCRIKVYEKLYGKVSNIVYFLDPTARSTCATSANSTCPDAVYAQIVEVDKRVIKVGNTELSLLRRKLASVDKAGAAITMSVSKNTGDSTAIRFEILGSNTMIGYKSDGKPDGVLDAERYLTTSTLDDEIVTHVVRSSPSCTGFMDIQLQDRNNSFATYDLRLPCSRTTDKVEDKIQLTFDFDLTYDLVSNKLDAEAHYLSAMASAHVASFDNATMYNLGLSQNLTVTAAFGYCSDNNAFVKQNSAGEDFSNCAQNADDNGKWTDSEGNQKFTSNNKLNLTSWKDCAYEVEDRGDESSYIITTKVAMRYKRVLTYYNSNVGSDVVSTNYFCADRQYTTTIKRDATASVSVATLRAPTLQRAVNVIDISWESCNQGLGYELHIDITNQQKDITSSTWITANTLSRVLKPVSDTADDSDNLMIDTGTMGEGALQESEFTLKSSCITITRADCDALASPESTAAGGSTEYAKLSHTKTDLVLRGAFQGGGDVDSDVTITTMYMECPLAEDNVATGFIRAGAQLVCDAAITNSARSDITGQNDCTEAYTTDKGTAIAKLYLSSSETATLTTSDHNKANNAGWQPRHVKIFIERYEKEFLQSGTATGTLLSSDQFCECGAADTEYDSSTACKDSATDPNLKDRITQLNKFNTLVCGNITVLNATAQTSTNLYDRIQFDFSPLADATNDLFRVRFDILSENTNLNTNGARRLRRSRTVYTLGATEAAVASSSALVIRPAETQQGGNPAAAPAAPVPSAPVSSNTTTTAAPTTAAPVEEDELSTGVIVGIVAGSVVGLIVIIWGVMWAMRGCSTSDIPVFSPASSGDFGGAAVGFSDAGRQRRFNNLRY